MKPFFPLMRSRPQAARFFCEQRQSRCTTAVPSETAMNEGYGSSRGRRGQTLGGGGGGRRSRHTAAIASVLALSVLSANVSAFVPPLSSSVRGESHTHHEHPRGGGGRGDRALPVHLLLLPCLRRGGDFDAPTEVTTAVSSCSRLCYVTWYVDVDAPSPTSHDTAWSQETLICEHSEALALR